MKSELIPSNGDTPIRITKDVTVVGRREFCDVQVDHPSLSKRHCLLVRTDGLLMVRDLASTNGTKVNGQKVSWAALLPNDRLTIGRCKFKVYLGSDEAPSPSEIVRKRSNLPNTPKSAPARVGDETGMVRAGFTPLAAIASPVRGSGSGSTDPDAEIAGEEFLIDEDEEELFEIDLD